MKIRNGLIGLALLLLTGGTADAVTIEIGLQSTTGPIMVFASSLNSAAISGVLFGGFSTDASGTGSPPLTGGVLLEGNTISGTALSVGIFDIWVTSVGNTGPIGPGPFGTGQQFESSFTNPAGRVRCNIVS